MFKGGKLKFKGSSKSSITKTDQNISNSKKEDSEAQTIPEEILSIPDEGWIKATDPEDFLGPIMLIIQDEHFYLLKIDEDRGLINFEEAVFDDTPEEPFSTANVLVGQNLIPQVFSFKSVFGKYLTTDSLGQVACNKEAVNSLAEWTIVIRPEGVALQNVHQKFLSFDLKNSRLRCDSETIGFKETFIVKCRADRKKTRMLNKFRAEQLANLKTGNTQLELATLEEIESKKQQSFGWGRKESKKERPATELKRAAEVGNLRETLLERRIKSKHDPFC